MPVSTKPEGTLASLDHPSARDFYFLREADDVFEKQISKLSLRHRRNDNAIQGSLEALSKMSAHHGHTLKLDPISVYLFSADWDTNDGRFQALSAT